MSKCLKILTLNILSVFAGGCFSTSEVSHPTRSNTPTDTASPRTVRSPRATRNPKVMRSPSESAAPSETASPNMDARRETSGPRDDLPRATTVAAPRLTALAQGHSAAIVGGAAEWREYAEKCLTRRDYPEASRAFAREAEIYRKTDPQAARVEALKAARYHCQLEVFRRIRTEDHGDSPQDQRKLERLEPPSGCYAGAFIDRDDRLASHAFGSQVFGDIEHFNSLTEKKHASFFTYLRYGNPFPSQWAAYVKEQKAICHLAWEPDNLEQVQEDRYLQQFVAQLKAYDHPVILRFAGEMNGNWTPYHKDPARYRAAFRLMHRMTRDCPRVALLWCPNSVPAENIEAYYPGDDGCDWVGVNLYSVLFIDNDPKTPGDWIHPLDLLEPIYRAYATRKPIAIGEYAASHQAACKPGVNLAFAQIKMSQLYANLPLRYPKVKMINWYDCNNIKKARAGRQLNNYQLTDSSRLLETYETHINNGYYLGPQEVADWRASRLKNKQVLLAQEELKLHFFARCHIPNPIVYLKVDKTWRWRGQLPSPLACNLGRLSPGHHKLQVQLADLQGHLLESQDFAVHIK